MIRETYIRSKLIASGGTRIRKISIKFGSDLHQSGPKAQGEFGATETQNLKTQHIKSTK